MFEWLRSRRYPLVLAVICGAVLALGILLRPAKQEQEARISPADLERLQRRTIRKRLDDLASHFQVVANEVSSFVVSIGSTGASGSNGVIWSTQGMVLAAKSSAPAPQSMTVATAKGQRQPAEVIWRPRELPLIAVKTKLESVPPQISALKDLDAGVWLVIVAHRPEQPPLVVPAVYSGQRVTSCGAWAFHELQVNSMLADDELGAGVFTLDHALAGLVLRCRDRLLVASAEDLQSALQLSRSPETRVVDEFGLRLSSLNDPLKARFAATAGVLITDVWDDSPAARAGLVPGDVLLAIDDAPVIDAAQAEQTLLLGHEGDIALKLLRSGRTTQVKLPMGTAETTDTSIEYAGIKVAPQPKGVPVGEIKPGSPADRAGVRPGDLLLAVNGRAVTSGSSRLAILESEKSAYLVLRRDGKTYGVLLP